MAAKDKKNRATVIIRKEEIIEGGHHGGAWKVAYADFVTAMMAFFLLMWLLNATTEEQRKGLADYFTPMNVLSRNSSGTGQPFGGHTPYDNGSLASDRGAEPVMPGKAPPASEEDLEGDQTGVAEANVAPHQTGPKEMAAQAGEGNRAHGNALKANELTGDLSPGGGAGIKPVPRPRPDAVAHPAAGAAAKPNPNPNKIEQTAARLAAERAERAEQAEKAAFDQAAQQIREAVKADPQLADLAKQLAIDVTPEGLRVQLLDEDKQAMFATGSTVFNDRAKQLMQKVAPVLAKLPEQLSITGHTDAEPYKGGDRSNWELSSERANATRRLLVEAGLPEARFSQISGRADHDLLLPADPLAAANRRIAIVVLRSAHTP